MEDCNAKVANLAWHLRDKHRWSVGGAAPAISVYGLRKPYERQIKTTPGKIQGSKKTSYQRKQKMCPYCLKNFVRLDEHLIKHVEQGGEQYNNALANAAIYSPSKYILSANRSPKKAAGPELPKFDLAKSIDTDALISESPSISFAIESPSECSSLTMEVDSPDVSDSTSKDNPSYSPDAAEILEEFYLPDIIETCLVEFRKFLEGPECFLAKSKEIVAEARRIFIALKLKNIDQLIEGTCIRDYYLAQYCVKQDYRPDSIKKYLRSLNEFVTFLVLKKKKKSSNMI